MNWAVTGRDWAVTGCYCMWGRYRDDEPLEEAGEAVRAKGLPSVTEDAQLVAFWEGARVAAMGPGAPLALPPLSFVALRDYLVHFMFHVTAPLLAVTVRF